MATILERWSTEEAPAVIQSALFRKNGDKVELVEACRSHSEAEEKAATDKTLVVGFINEEDRIWKLPDCWVFLSTGEVRPV